MLKLFWKRFARETAPRLRGESHSFCVNADPSLDSLSLVQLADLPPDVLRDLCATTPCRRG